MNSCQAISTVANYIILCVLEPDWIWSSKYYEFLSNVSQPIWESTISNENIYITWNNNHIRVSDKWDNISFMSSNTDHGCTVVITDNLDPIEFYFT